MPLSLYCSTIDEKFGHCATGGLLRMTGSSLTMICSWRLAFSRISTTTSVPLSQVRMRRAPPVGAVLDARPDAVGQRSGRRGQRRLRRIRSRRGIAAVSRPKSPAASSRWNDDPLGVPTAVVVAGAAALEAVEAIEIGATLRGAAARRERCECAEREHGDGQSAVPQHAGARAAALGGFVLEAQLSRIPPSPPAARRRNSHERLRFVDLGYLILIPARSSSRKRVHA